MRMAQDAGALHLLGYSDSQLIVKQVSGEYEAMEKSMVQYLQQIEELKTKYKSFQLQLIPREKNVKADSLSKLACALEDCKTRRIIVQHLPQPRGSLNIQGTLDPKWDGPYKITKIIGHEAYEIRNKLVSKRCALKAQASSRPGGLAPCELAVCDQASSRPAIWLTRNLQARELASSHPASSWPVTLPARGMLSSRPASWLS
ncbi:UNVERIFIED_CONTAM: hypothetical protein Slati_0184500 [Sesamum latifolium]|uniref:RNase H type-1 domain-containing protein n=1 Tax=Sesamum latifolium TaxID=2727402 RepID=A0AAW2YB44_9LAMI